MKLAVFGATGAIGRLVITQALADGYEVTAYARNPGDLLDIRDFGLTVIVGELADTTAVRRAVRDADAVISALGPSRSRKATGMPLVDGVGTIVAAMRSEGVQRFIGIATPSLIDRRDRPSVLGRVVPVMGRTRFPRASRELLAMSRLVTASCLDWTIARYVRPTDGTATGTVRAGYLGVDRIGSSITRADIAGFLLDQVTEPRFHRAAPAISN